MNVVLIGGKHFGCLALHLLASKSDITVSQVIITDAEDRLGKLAVKLGYNVFLAPNPKIISEGIVDCDLIITAYTHAYVSNKALEKSKLGGIGYHPSLLPRHRGKHAVEDTIASKDTIAGGTIYQLSQGWDEGNIVLQDWCFVKEHDDAGTLWRRELSPMGIRLLSTALDNILHLGTIVSTAQENNGITKGEQDA